MVGAARDDHREEGVAGEGHAVRFLDNGGETKHFGVHFQWGDCSGGDDDGGEAVEDGLNGNGGIKAGKVEDWVRNGCGVGLKGFEDEEEPFVVGCCKGGEGGYFLEWLIVFDVCEFEGSDEGCESFCAESERFPFDEGQLLQMLEE